MISGQTGIPLSRVRQIRLKLNSLPPSKTTEKKDSNKISIAKTDKKDVRYIKKIIPKNEHVHVLAKKEKGVVIV